MHLLELKRSIENGIGQCECNEKIQPAFVWFTYGWIDMRPIDLNMVRNPRRLGLIHQDDARRSFSSQIARDFAGKIELVIYRSEGNHMRRASSWWSRVLSETSMTV